MMFKYLCLYICCIILIVLQNEVKSVEPGGSGEIWAFLVAGSDGYYNYRHQADVCHAYQILKKNGIPENNIIVMMADDVAYHAKNPTPGILINKPNGTDVYKGVRKDYTGNNVTGENFIHVLTGNKTAMKGVGSGRVIESNLNDFIFVYFADHGTTGSLCFLDDLLAALDLHEALKTMVNEKKFQKMVLYIEACESGSMFDDILEDDSNIFVMTAADTKESSYACYYDKYRDAYLGDLFSVNWMEEVERETLDKSLHHLFEKVRTKTGKSHVEEYGDLDIGNTKLSTFLKSNLGHKRNDIAIDLGSEMDMVKSEDVPIEILKKKLNKANVQNDIGSVKKYINELREIYHQRELIDKTLDKLLNRITKGNKEKLSYMKQTNVAINRNNMACCKEVTNAFSNKCFNIPRNPYVGKVMYPLLNVCNSNEISVSEAVDIIETVCSA